MKQAAYNTVYLTACAVNSIKPDKEKVTAMNMEKLFEFCQFHSLTSLVCMAIESAGIKPDKKWIEAKAKAIRKVMLHDAEREIILKYMEENGIWYMPMKGVILKELYPKSGMRQMTDNDILYDAAYQNELYRFMTGRGYQPKHIGKRCDDVYMKEPVYNFEMHRKLFEHTSIPEITRYYSDPKSLTVSDGKSKFGRKFTDENFYIYITAHEYKHYSIGGTGWRSLLDCYVYLKNKADKLDRCYIDKELEKLGISEYEKRSADLAMRIFSSPILPKLSEEETRELESYMFSGTYGTMKKFAERNVERYIGNNSENTKFGYYRSRIFPPMSFYKEYFPFCYKTKVLIPFAWIYRMVRGVLFKRNIVKNEVCAVNKIIKQRRRIWEK